MCREQRQLLGSPYTGEARTALSCLCGTTPSKCDRTAVAPKYLPLWGKYFIRAKRVFHRDEGVISHGGLPPYFTAKKAPCSFEHGVFFA